MKKRRVRRKTGDVVSIPLGEGNFAFGRVLEAPLMAFYDFTVEVVPPFEKIISCPVIFRLLVMNYAVTDGDWPVIGNAALEEDLLIKPRFFGWDVFTKQIYTTYDGSEKIPATAVECEGLERVAVWEPQHVVERLRDHVAGRKSAIVERLSLENM